MKSKWFQNLLWPNLWVGIFAVLALAGVACLLMGYRNVGLWLLAPLLLGGLVLIAVIIPILIRVNRKHRNTSRKNKP